MASAFGPILFLQRRTDLLAHRGKEREAHSSADDERIGFVDKRINDLDLVGNLRAAQDSDKGALGIIEHARNRVDFLCHQVSRIGGKKLGNTTDGCMCAMSSTERVVDEHVGE